MEYLNRITRSTLVGLAVWLAAGCGRVGAAAGELQVVDLRRAVIVVDSSNRHHKKAAEMLSEEIAKRTGLRLAVSGRMPGNDLPVIRLGTVEALPAAYQLPAGLEVPERAEGYAIWVDDRRGKAVVHLVGRDDRGALFAAGRLIRVLEMGRQKLLLPRRTRLADAPAYPLRGHMLIPGGRFISWDDGAFEQLIRDMVIFGTNSFELLRPRPGVAKILDDYGLDLWFFFGHGNVVETQTLEATRRRFGRLRGLDHVFIPLGDTGGVKPTRQMIAATERFAPLLKQVHPDARIWLSHQNQAYHAENDNEFLFGYIRNKQPTWLEGMVYGPWAHWDIPGLRRRTPKQYKIRHYPDICHNLWCQYPIPKWDRAFARVWGRNGIRAMPRMMARVHNVTAPLTVGFVAYNHTGCNNDVDKFVFSAMAWNPNGDVEQVLFEYGKVFFGDELAADVAKGLLMLEDNWRKPVAGNEQIEKTLAHWQGIARRYGDVSKNWRLGMYLYRATVDAWIKRKYEAEMQYERQAYEALRTAPARGVEAAIKDARKALARVDTEFPPKQQLTAELESWGLDRYMDGELEKVLDNLYHSLNDRQWLETEFAHILAMEDTGRQLRRIDRIINWEDPGPGGYYDNLGVAGRQPHLVRQKRWEDDPGYVHSPIEFNVHRPDSPFRQSWLVSALTRYDTPLRMRYANLDPQCSYRLRVVYSGPFDPVMRLVADGAYEIHGPMAQPKPMRPLEFDVPRQATADGVLELEWRLMNLRRGPSVAEAWLIKTSN